MLSLTQIVNECLPFLLPLLKRKTAVRSICKSGSDLVLSYLIPTGFNVFHKWLKKSSQLEIAIKSSINSGQRQLQAAHWILTLHSPGVCEGWLARMKRGSGSCQSEGPVASVFSWAPPAITGDGVSLFSHSPSSGPCTFFFVSELALLHWSDEGVHL